MTKHGYGTAVARDLLRLLEETMTIWKQHRELILENVTRYERSELERSRDLASSAKAL
ncbi:hypothetical protein [Microvirga sp. Mcv34]|uniref:hypothetical protein n=1 Tax=Microvirga sp. Mcv34 TaxID=2926016 RepID=UPI0021C81DB9|nr:hypothetical protein [Microvirga sp. Mcv34]